MVVGVGILKKKKKYYIFEIGSGQFYNDALKNILK